MRNLLGRLNARSTEELTRIATAWQVISPAGDRLGTIGRLYRALSDPRTVRDAWDLLPDDEKAMIRVLIATDEAALTLPDLAAALELDESETRDIATRLYRKAIVVREGDDGPLPVGVLPKLFLPRELVRQFRRIESDLEAGDLSGLPLRELLDRLDDREIEEAAEIWAGRIVPGLRERHELTDQIVEQVELPGRIDSIAATQRRNASLIWKHLKEQSAPAVPINAAYEATGLSPFEPEDVQQIREALSELETALLIWHSYRENGSRWLFIPSEIRNPPVRTIADLPPLSAVLTPPSKLPGWESPHAVAWDLLTYLRALHRPNAPRVHDAADFPRGWLRRLNPHLWHGAQLGIPEGYLEFLTNLARAEGLLEGGQGNDDPFKVSSAVRIWRDRSFDDQTARLIWWWLASPRWIEAIGRDQARVSGAEWIPFRRRLLAGLAALEAEQWYRLDQVTEWLAERDPDIVGATFEIASARSLAGSARGSSELARRRAATAEIAAITLETSLRWFGIVEFAEDEPGIRLLRLTARGRALSRGAKIPPQPGPSVKPPIAVEQDGTIEIAAPSPFIVWSLSAFADVASLGERSVYRITDATANLAFQAGFDTRQVISFLETQSGNPLPPELLEKLHLWAAGYRRLRLSNAIVVTPDNAAWLPELVEIAKTHELRYQLVGEQLLIFPKAPDGDDPPIDPAFLFREAGFSPQVGLPRTPKPDSPGGKAS
jgi:hypothetical protein